MHGLEKGGASGFALIVSLISRFRFASLQLSVLLTAWLLVHMLSAYQKFKFVWRSSKKPRPEFFRNTKAKHGYIEIDSVCCVSQNAEIFF